MKQQSEEAVDLSQYSEAELDIISMIEDNGHPLTEWWIAAYLLAARSVLGPNL
jgi:hypothetical protein